ncbi:MAG: hypothetical protein K2J70_06125, partial [Muribaculaceae bacterium]|nr:hypothetical protein [Muribaculaceae bacterium]
MIKTVPIGLLSAALAIGSISCNKKSDEEVDETASIVYLPNVAVTAFNLKANSSVMARLDSVFFSIDLEKGVIFNADSLPKGSKIDKLVTNISYSSAITSATIIMEGGTTRNGTVDYIKNPGDSIDFTGNVQLEIATANEEMKKRYTIKVNVHQQEPDSLVWNETALTSLPSRMASPRNQKTVEFDGKAISLIEENNGSITLSSSDDLYSDSWTKKEISLPFIPEIRSMAAADDALYILDTDGNLFTSSDGTSWHDTGEDWQRIIGGYTDSVIGLKSGNSGMIYAQYPLKNLKEQAVDSEFPVTGHSNFVVHANKWTSSPVGFFCGGEKADGSLSEDTWAFDGSLWISLSKGGFPKLKGASLI